MMNATQHLLQDETVLSQANTTHSLIGVSIWFIIGCLYAVLSLQKKRHPLIELPVIPGAHWLLGHAPIFALELETGLRKLAYDYANSDGLTALWVFSRPACAVNKAEHARSVLMSSSEKGPTVHTKHLTMFLGKNSIINKDGKEWKIHRKNMTRTFSAETVDNLDEPVRKETSKIIGALFEKLDSDANGEYRMNGENFSAAIVSRIVGTVFFGFELGGSVLEKDELSVKYSNLLEEFDRRMKSPFNPAARLYSLPTASNIKYKNDHRYARQMFLDTLKKHSKRDDSGTTESWKGRSDFLMAILDFVVEEQGYSIDDDEIQNMVNAAYLFSIESLSTTVQYMIYSIQQNPGFEQKCLKEINALLDRTGTVDVDQLPYCDAFITEVLRLYPVIPFSWRQLESPLKLGNTTLPTGMKVYVPFFLLHRDERNFPRPTELLPERWVQHSSDGGWEDRDDSKRNKELADADGVTQDTDADPIPAGLRQNLFTFGKGGRGCPGMKIAKKEACILFTELIRHFKFEVEPGYVLKPSVKGVGQKPLGGIPFIVRRR